jgi:uncharacterized membrane protein YphA (DoxX/SURF4 family)
MKNRFHFDFKKLFFTLLRIAIGWHFLYEGFSKVFANDWTSYYYLTGTTGPLSDFYHWLAASPGLLKVVDILNIWGLILIGIGLFIGCLSRLAAIAGTVLLALYYFAYPPFGVSLLGPTESHLYIVDKIFLEALALLFISFYKESGYGIDAFFEFFRKSKKGSVSENKISEPSSNTRRELIKNLSTLPVLGLMGWGAFASKKEYGVDVWSGATKQLQKLALKELKGTLPQGKIGKYEISRLVLGGNLIGGWSHARDLIYADNLFKAYNTEEKIFQTLVLAERAGINTINIGYPTNPVIQKYKKLYGSNIKVLSQVAPVRKNGDDKIIDVYAQINGAIDSGADILQVQGNWCDWCVRDKRIEVIAKMIDRIREHGYLAGLGAHTIDSLIACEEFGIVPDYYMKTMHHDKYWSAHPVENRVPFEVDGTNYLDHNKFHNNLFDLFPERTIEFVQKAKVPVMGFKILAAGAIQPKDGFNYAFMNGADFICVGMFDFQIVNDVNICIETLNNLGDTRKRKWFG